MNRIIQTAVNFFEQHLLAKHLANPIVIDFDECLNVKIPT